MSERCSDGFARESDTLSCIDPNNLPSDYCDQLCGSSGGKFNTTEGRCSCNSYTVTKEICNSTCLARSPTVELQRETNGVLYLKITDNEGTVTKVRINDEYGINDYDRVARKAEILQFNSDGLFGYLPPDSSTALELVATSSSSVVSRKRRAISNTSVATVPQGIRSPIVCVSIGQVVLFKITLDSVNRSLSHYPRYSKNHLFNTNPRFDYGQFRQLHSLITTTNLTITTFANVFSEDGRYVFYDNAESKRETIIVVPKQGSSCPGRMDASSPAILPIYNVGPAEVCLLLILHF